MKKFTSILLVAVMLATMTAAMIPAASAAWDGSSASVGLVGSGTELDPYLISSENDLAYVAKTFNETALTAPNPLAGCYFKLTVDLDLGGQNWTPIGYAKTFEFSGHFDGDGHTISNLTCKSVDGNLYAGLFGRIIDGSVKNLTIDGANVIGDKYAGVIAGLLNCTVSTGSVVISNCHVLNAEVKGIQVGGLIGRSSKDKADKGQLQIVGCTATNVTIGYLTTDDYSAPDTKNHFVGGIVGGAGSTVIDGCVVKNMTANVYGTSFAPAGGIVGVMGADSKSSDVTNCAVVGATFTCDAASAAEKTNVGGLIGKAAHVAVALGDPNTEYNIFNCFVSDISITNNTTAVTNGVLIGLVNDTIYFNNVYYVPTSGLESFGADTYYQEWPFISINAVSELTAAQLNKGNSTAVWVDDVVMGHPVIDVDAALANEPTYVDYFVENAPETSEEETTEAPVETTEEPAETTEAPVETTEEPVVTDAPTEAPVVTDAPAATDAPKSEGGCGGMIAGGVVIVALLGTAVVFKKRD